MRATLATSLLGAYALPNDRGNVADEERTAVILRLAQDDRLGF
jgi:hypothetical protein